MAPWPTPQAPPKAADQLYRCFSLQYATGSLHAGHRRTGLSFTTRASISNGSARRPMRPANDRASSSSDDSFARRARRISSSEPARLRDEGVVVPVTLIGDGPERPRLERLASNARLDVKFLGSRPHEDVVRAMRVAAALCAPSRSTRTGEREGFGMVLLEAQATGLPVVATSSGGMVEAVDDGRTGLLVPEGDQAALTAALRACLTDPDLRDRLTRATRPWVEQHFDLRRQTHRLEDWYDVWAGGE